MVSHSDSVKITPKKLSLNWKISNLATATPEELSESKSMVYNFSGYRAYADVVGVIDGESVALNYSNNEYKNVGQYQTMASLDPSYSNYELTAESIAWSITPYVLDFTWSFNGATKDVSNGKIPTFTYNASAVSVVASYAPLGTDVVNLVYSSSANDITEINASTENYKVTVASLDNGNYAIGANSSFEWKIDPKVVKVSWTSGDSTVYNGTYKGSVFTLDGVLDNNRFVGGSVNGTQAYFEITSVDSSIQYNFADKKLAINADTYTHNISAIYTYTGTEYTVDTNYTVEGTAKDLEIKKAPLTLVGWKYTNNGATASFSENSKLVYNTQLFEITNSIVENLFEREGVADEVYLVYEGNAATYYNESGYQASVSLGGAHAANYYISDETSVDWMIQQKPITVEWVTNNFEYISRNSYFNQYANPISGATTDDDLKVYSLDYISFSYEDNHQSKAGKYTAKIVSISNNNYKLVENATYDWEVAKKVIDISWDTNSFTYNGSVQQPIGFYSGNDYVLVSEYEVTESKNVGTYTVKAIALDNANYELSTSSKIAHNYTINPRVINFTWGYNDDRTTAANYTYDGISRVVNAYADIVAGDTVNFTYSELSGTVDRTIRNAGTYSFAITSIDNENYVLNGDSTGTTITLTVSPRVINLVWKFDNNTSSAGNYTYAGEKKTIAAYVNNLCGTDVVNLSYNTDDFELLNAGTYSYEVTGCDNANYALPATTSKSITVSQKELRFTWYFGNDTTNIASNFTYDGFTYTVNAFANNLCGDDEITLVFDKANREVCDAASYTFNVTGISGEDAINYKLPTSSSYYRKSITVSKQTVAITWAGETAITYDGNAHSLTATLKGTYKGSPVTITPVYSSGVNSYTDAGSYTIKVSGLEDSSNYALPSSGTSKDLKISRQAVTVTWTGSTSVVYDGYMHYLTATVKGADDNKNIEFNYNNSNTNGFSNAGSYDISISLNNANYTIEGQTTGKKLDITPQEVEIEWAFDKNIVYDGNYHYATATVKGADDGKTLATIYSGNNGFIDAGTYAITVSSTGNSNYKLPTDGSATVNITIAPQPVTVVWTYTGEIMYDGLSHAPEAVINAKNTGETVSFSYSSTNTITNVGTLSRSIKLSSNNYTLEGMTGSDTGTVTIIPQTVTISWDNVGTITYDGASHRPVATVRGTLDGKTVSSLSYSNTKYISNAGETTTRTVSIANGNYTLEGCEGETSGTLTIEKQRVKITWTGATSAVYDGTEHSLVATVRGYDNDVNVSCTYDGLNYGRDAGVYNIGLVLSDSNYTLEDCVGDTQKTLTITPQSVVITWTGAGEYEYDGSTYTLTATVKGMDDHQEIRFNYTADSVNQFINAGTYTATVEQLLDSNYTLDGAILSATTTITAQE